MQRLRPLLLAAAVLLAAGCRDSDPTSARAPQATARDIQLALESDSTPPPPAPARPASFLPPLARPASLPGVFDPSLAPVVEVCAAADEACASPVARFTTGGSGAAAVRADSAAGQYIVNWSTAGSSLTTGGRYRIRVSVDGTEAASQAIRVVANGAGARGVAADEVPVVNGRTLPIKFYVQKVRRLSVVVDSGAVGTPPQQDVMLPFGAEVPYAYHAAEGYHGLVVTVDGQAAPASGTVVMDGDHVIAAAAEKERTIPAGAEPLVESARAILTAADKPAAYQHHLDLVADLYAQMGIEAGNARMDSVYALAWDAVADSAAIDGMNRALSNHVFSITPGHGVPAGVSANKLSGRGVRAALAVSPATRQKVSFFTINGVIVGRNSAAQNLAVARQAILDNGAGSLDDGYYLFYNTTFDRENSGGLAVHRCFDKALSDHTFLGYVILVPRLVICAGDAIGRFIIHNDFTEALRELLNVSGTLPIGAEPDAKAWADTLAHRQAQGENIVLLPHSQGNLLTQEAVHINRRDRPETQERLCVSVVSAAAPTSGHFGLRSGLEQGLYVRDDIILLIPFTQSYPEIDTDKSKHARDTWNKWYWWITGLRPVVKLIERYSLHGFTDSYLGARQSRDYIMNAIKDERRTMDGMTECALAHVATVEVTPPTAFVPQLNAVSLYATAKDSSGKVITGRPVRWSTNDPTIATVSQDGIVEGVGDGTVTITATIDGVSGSAQVTVEASVFSVQVSPASFALQAGQTRALTAVAHDEYGHTITGRPVEWTSSDPAVATVDGAGTVTGVGGGRATITAAVEGIEGTSSVTVTATDTTPSQSLVLPVGAASTWTVTPGATGSVTLRFDARIDAGGTAGNSTLLEVTVNGVPVTASSLLNKAAQYTYTNRGGTEPYYQNRGSSYGQADAYWGLFWSPDFSQNNDPSDYYAVAGGQAYTYVLDISSLVSRGQTNTVTLRNHGEWLVNLGLQPVIHLQNVSVQ